VVVVGAEKLGGFKEFKRGINNDAFGMSGDWDG